MAIEEPMVVSAILPDLEMIPEVHTSKPSFLMRRSRSPTPPKDSDTKSRQHVVPASQRFQPRANQVNLIRWLCDNQPIWYLGPGISLTLIASWLAGDMFGGFKH